MELFERDNGVELGQEGNSALRELLVGNHSEVTELLRMEQPISPGGQYLDEEVDPDTNFNF